MPEELIECPYCRQSCDVEYRSLRHPFWEPMHTIDMYKCPSCGSLTTFPMPSDELLARCYSTSSFGYPAHKSNAKRGSQQIIWYRDILNIFGIGSVDGEIIADVGAGEGLLVQALSHRSKLGIQMDCYDYHSIPPRIQYLEQSKCNLALRWIQADLSVPDWVPAERYDRAFCISVVEHMRDPRRLISDLLRMCKPGGKVYVIGPCVDALCYTLLKSRWPYIIPGEHLTIPSIGGLHELLKTLRCTSSIVKRINVTYSLKYILDAVFKLNTPTFLDVTLRLPIGAFSMTITK